ncbi:MAG: hypothetical protein P1V20_26095 [Verrucomicrobiales bacterium]|nr:hypothetical protein [Verrucomicrobiales bacterium]
MKNPYDDIKHHPSKVVFSGKPLLAVLFVFLGFLVLVPLVRHLTEFSKPDEERWFPVVELWNIHGERSFNLLFEKKAKNPAVTRQTPNLRDHLQALEAGVKDSPFRKRIQKSEQTVLSTVFGKGNSKVVTGKDGWLYYRPAIDALTGRGPFEPEPDSVTKDPDRPLWQEPLPVIAKFAKQLRERNIDLMIVPIPVKPMIETEGLGLSGVIRHPDQERFYQALKDMGITVVDLLPAFAAAKSNGDVFLRQDTHWRAEIAKESARIVSDEIKKLSWYAATEKKPAPVIQSVTRSGIGDLAEMMGTGRFKPEIQTLERVLDPETKTAIEGSLLSPLCVIGDSFVNMYEEPGLGYGSDDEGLIGAGFASHLSDFLKMRPMVLAINGEGATGIRQRFASHPDNVVRSKKLLIWAIASRDFLLSESAANRTGVLWRDVEFNPETEHTPEDPPTTENDGDLLILSGTLKEKSAIEDPQRTSYSEAIYSTVFDNITVLKGEYFDAEAYVFLWAFKDRKLLPSARLEVGKKYRLTLDAMRKHPELSRKTQLDDLLRYDIDRLFAIEVEED